MRNFLKWPEVSPEMSFSRSRLNTEEQNTKKKVKLSQRQTSQSTQGQVWYIRSLPHYTRKNLKRNNQWSFWICIWEKLWQENIVTMRAFSKSSYRWYASGSFYCSCTVVLNVCVKSIPTHAFGMTAWLRWFLHCSLYTVFQLTRLHLCRDPEAKV